METVPGIEPGQEGLQPTCFDHEETAVEVVAGVGIEPTCLSASGLQPPGPTRNRSPPRGCDYSYRRNSYTDFSIPRLDHAVLPRQTTSNHGPGSQDHQPSQTQHPLGPRRRSGVRTVKTSFRTKRSQRSPTPRRRPRDNSNS